MDDCGRRARFQGLCFGHHHNGVDGEIAPRLSRSARDETGRKHCRTCDQWLPVEWFTKDFRSKDGRRSLCLACHSSRRREMKFGVSADWFDETLAAQGGRCAICRGDEPRGRGWAIDHDHNCCPDKATSCGRCVRAILCSPCNLALGLMGDDAERLSAAADYVRAHSPERMSIVRGV